MKLWEHGLRRMHSAVGLSERHDVTTINDWILLFGGHQYPLGLPQTIRGDKEPPPTTFEQFAMLLFAANPVVFGAELIRKAVFSQARFQYRRQSTGELFGDPSLRLLERPWTGGTTPKLLTRMLQHADFGGNAYVVRIPHGPPRVQLMRPDWVTIVLGSELEPDDPSIAEDAELIGFMYMPLRGGRPRLYLPDEVAHFAPMPDPLAHFRGMSWLTPVVREIQGDKMMTEHKLKFFEQGASPNIIIRFDPSQTLAQVKAFKELVEEGHQGLADAYKTMYLGGGADATVVGANLQQLDFSTTVGKAETRILMAAGVHPVIAGASEGLAGAGLNAGNFSQVRRIFSDIHLQDLWGEAAASLQVLVPPPPGAELAMDGRRMPFLQDDGKDEAEIQRSQSRTISALVREGYRPDSVVAAVVANDMRLLVHSGLMSVQLQPPITPDNDSDEDEDGEGDGDGDPSD
ncbi:MAG: phage portal protein [Pseudonocardiaceae bacterium]